MKIEDVDLLKLLPEFMRKDEAVVALASAVNNLIREPAKKIKTIRVWDQIDAMDDAQLDEMAWELNVLWYDKNADISIKRDVLKNSDLVHMRLGTKWAMENVIASYFGNGYIEEWFEYGGKPGYFVVHTTNPSLANERFAEFLELLDKVKRVTARLDRVAIDLTGQVTINAGVAFFESSVERYSIGGSEP